LYAAGKTDYRARKRLVVQDKNKYASPRYRLVVRVTNHYIIAQIVYSELNGDKTLASAYSSELPRYGMPVGLKNYAAAYATGLLLARRVLKKLGLDELYPGNEEITGEVVKTEVTRDSGKTREHYVAEVSEERKPFRAALDVGVRSTTTGNRVFAILKGAADGGLDIPHNEKRFPGYNRDGDKYDAEFHKDRIYGRHIVEYAEIMIEEEPEQYQKKFSQYHAAGINPEELDTLYEEVHAKIREDPSPAPKSSYVPDKKSFKRQTKSSLETRKANLAAKKAARLASLQAATGGDMEDDE
jgi:large subunit ribosomal protein L5e